MCSYSTFFYKSWTGSQKKKGTTSLSAFIEKLYLLIVALYVLKAFFDTSLFHLPWPENYEKILRLLVCLILFFKIRNQKSFRGFEWILGILTLILIKGSWLSTGYDFLLDTGLLIIGAIDTSYKKILKVGFWVGLYLLLLAILGNFTGCIPDLIYLEGNQLMHSFGIVYPTDFAAHIAFLFLAGWVLYGKSGRLSSVLALGLCIFVWHYTSSKCSTIILFLSSIGCIYAFLAEKHKGHSKLLKPFVTAIGKMQVYVFPICALLMILLTLLYSADHLMMTKFDSLLSGRLSLGQNAINKYGIKLFGTAFAQQGYGGTTAWSWALQYTFVDSSYVLLLVRYGLGILLILCVHTIYICKNAYKLQKQRLLVAIGLVAVHSMIEHHFSEIAYNLFLLLPFAQYHSDELNKKENSCEIGKGKRTLLAAKIVCFAFLMALLPRFITYMKTIVELCRLDAPENHIWFIIVMSVILLWFGIFIALIQKVAVAIVTKSALHRMVPIGLIMSLVFFFSVLLKGNGIIQKGLDAYGKLLGLDRPIIQALLAQDPSSKLYIDHVPELYKREFEKLSDKILSAEGMASKKNITLITKDDGELRALTSAGYEYGQLTSGHSVYTNDQNAKVLLKELNIELTDFYSKKRLVDLDGAARKNKLQLTEDGFLLLSNSANALLHGPGITIYRGTVHVQYMLRLIDNANADGPIATVGISSDNGLRVWIQEDIFLQNFDENGMCMYVLECALPFDCPFVEFTLSIPDNVVLEIQSIAYGKVN